MWGFALLLILATAAGGFWLGFIVASDLTRHRLLTQLRGIKQEKGWH